MLTYRRASPVNLLHQPESLFLISPYSCLHTVTFTGILAAKIWLPVQGISNFWLTGLQGAFFSPLLLLFLLL